MPHLHIEHSKGLEALISVPDLLAALHGALVASEVFPTAGIRVRAFAADHALVADGLLQNHFLAMTLSVGAGRDKSVLQAEGARLFEIAQTQLAELLSAPHFALSFEIREVDSELSWKDTPIHGRLSAQARDQKT